MLVGLQGSVIGEMEHSVESLSPVVLCVFQRDNLATLFEGYPSLAFDVTWLASREERTSISVTSGDELAPERLARRPKRCGASCGIFTPMFRVDIRRNTNTGRHARVRTFHCRELLNR